MIDVTYPKLLDLFREHLNPKRSESASFLIWYFENYYRLDTLDAVDSVCDQKGDKGVDGIFVNDSDQTITIFQSKINQNPASTIGDKSLREFAGTITQFNDTNSIKNLIATAGQTELAKLAKTLDLENKITTHDLRGEFVSNVDIDLNGAAFLATNPKILFVGRKDLIQSYISDERDQPIHKTASFDIQGTKIAEYIVDSATKAIIAPVKATDLVSLEGIADQSLFTHNVRGPLGRTKVNKDITKTIKEPSSHKFFPLFHNGITIIAGSLDADDDAITAGDYFVVNGCQSLTALYDNRTKITDDLRVLTKFIKMDPQSSWAKTITEISNNQNGVRARDFKSNHQIHIRLQNEFRQHYEGVYEYQIKRGDPEGEGVVISNEEAGLYLMAFDLKEPWGTHRKYQVFEDKHGDLFARPEVNADRIVLCRVIIEAISKVLPDINNQLLARYVLVQYMLLYIVRKIMETSDLKEILQTPELFVRSVADRDRFAAVMLAVCKEIVVDLNAEIDAEEDKNNGKEFYYREKLRDSDWVKTTGASIVGDYQKQIIRGRADSLKHQWERAQAS